MHRSTLAMLTNELPAMVTSTRHSWRLSSESLCGGRRPVHSNPKAMDQQQLLELELVPALVLELVLAVRLWKLLW